MRNNFVDNFFTTKTDLHRKGRQLLHEIGRTYSPVRTQRFEIAHRSARAFWNLPVRPAVRTTAKL